MLVFLRLGFYQAFFFVFWFVGVLLVHVLVTGASSGIGLALVRGLLLQGCFVWAGLRQPEILDELVAQNPGRLRALCLDVTVPSDVEQAFRLISEAVPSEFVLINNAGIALGGPVELLPDVEWRKVFDVNVFGLVAVTKVFLPLLRRVQGRVINIGSISGRIASPFLAPYSASKFAVRAISDSLRREMIPFGVNVILIEPGPIDTNIWSKSIEHSNAVAHDVLLDESAAGLEDIYGEAMVRLNSAVADVAKAAAPVSWVLDKIDHAMNSAAPKAYYLVGKGIWFQAFLAKHLPTKWMDALMGRGFRFTAGKKS